MKRYLLAAFVVLLVTPGMAPAQMMGKGMSGGDAPSPPEARQEMLQKMQSPGMMSPMMSPMMDGMMDGMMSGRTRGCMMMAEGMMKGQFDLARLRKTLALSDEQMERLRAGVRPFQKEDILARAAMKVATLELADLLAGERVDFGKVEAKLKEIEGLRTKTRLAQLKAADAVKGILSTEQLELLQGAGECAPAPAEPRGATPQGDPEHQQHH